ncbi:Ras-related protein Rab-35 [Tritrichomonas foetus]|uniref:Ras-related protein Rab-35 n=1 Tax=Tritrichomonas foetus TaxID=1144522 RepID=A0A1J4KKG3_9EUKA|nr:Ras-related protein Rab-35 [Tritrichomonas foetus]|eukprot:OHT11793.1 Ras-related protein Rab-35 [Tritrichomonas foetus]
MITNYKVLLCGESSVGKTTIMQKVTSEYGGIPTPTMGCGFGNISEYVDGQEIAINFWDTAGQEQFRSLIKIYFRGAKIVLFVCDLGNKETLDSLPFWVNEAEENCGDEIPAGILIGNKKDQQEKNVISDDELQKAADNFNLVWFKTSAFDDDDIDKIKHVVAELCVKHQQKPKIYSFSKMKNHHLNGKISSVNSSKNHTGINTLENIDDTSDDDDELDDNNEINEYFDQNACNAQPVNIQIRNSSSYCNC